MAFPASLKLEFARLASSFVHDLTARLQSISHFRTRLWIGSPSCHRANNFTQLAVA